MTHFVVKVILRGPMTLM